MDPIDQSILGMMKKEIRDAIMSFILMILMSLHFQIWRAPNAIEIEISEFFL